MRLAATTGRRCRASGTSGGSHCGRRRHAIGAAQMPDLAGLRRRCIDGTARARSVADRGTRDRIGGRSRCRLGDRGAGEKSLQNHEPCRDQNDRAAAMRGKSGWHANLSHATLAHLIFGNLRIGGAREQPYGEPRHRLHRDHAGSAAQGLCLRHFSHGGQRRRPGALLDRAGDARHHSARSFSHAGAARPHRALRPVHRHRQPRLRRRARGLLGAAAGPPAHLDQYPHPRPLPQALRPSALSQPGSLRGRHPRRRSLWRDARCAPFSARACSTAPAMLPRSRSCISWPGSRPAASSCWIRNS